MLAIHGDLTSSSTENGRPAKRSPPLRDGLLVQSAEHCQRKRVDKWRGRAPFATIGQIFRNARFWERQVLADFGVHGAKKAPSLLEDAMENRTLAALGMRILASNHGAAFFRPATVQCPKIHPGDSSVASPI